MSHPRAIDSKDTSNNGSKDEENVGPRIVERKISPRGKELGQYLQDLYDSGAKLYTKQMFSDIEEQLTNGEKSDFLVLRSSK